MANTNQRYIVKMKISNGAFNQYCGQDRLRYFMIIMAMRCKQNVEGFIESDLDEIIRMCGYKVNRKQQTLNIYRSIIGEIIHSDANIRTNVPNWDVIQLKTRFKIFVPKDSPTFFPTQNFTIFQNDEFHVIAKDDGGVSHAVMAGVYLYLKRFMNEKEREPAYPTMSKICAGTGLSETTVKSAINRLKSVGLLYSDHYYVIGENNEPRNTINVYTNDQSVLSDARRIANLLSDRVYHGQKVVPSSKSNEQNDILVVDNIESISEQEETVAADQQPIEQQVVNQCPCDVDLHDVDLSLMNEDSIIGALYSHEDLYCEDEKFIASLPDSVIDRLSSFVDMPTVLEMVARQEHWRRQRKE